MNSLEDWIDALRALGCDPRRSGDQWKAKCPAHDDRNPSLSLTEELSGRVLVNCHASTACTFETILEHVKPYLSDRGDRGDLGGAPPKARARQTEREKLVPKELPSGRHVTQYFYRYADGSLVFAVIRTDRPGQGKRISQWIPREGLWLPKGPTGPLPLYRLPEIAATAETERVVVVEGEKCVEAVRRVWPRRPVTTWAMGAEGQKWRKTDWSPIAGREVTVVADGDPQGWAAAEEVAEMLTGLGCKVWIVLPKHDKVDNDVADWIANHGSQNAADRIAQLRTRYGSEGAPTTPAEPPDDDAVIAEALADVLRSNDHYRILGLSGDSIIVRTGAGQILYRSGEALTQRRSLVRLAPIKWWKDMLGSDAFGIGEGLRLGDALIRIADELGPVDMTRVLGRGAARVDYLGTAGEEEVVVYHLGDRILHGGQIVLLDWGAPNIWEAEPAIPLVEPCTQADLATIAEAVMRYRWMTPLDGRRMLGWIVAAIIGGALPWRPHLMLNAPAESGKTWLLEHVVEKVISPRLLLRFVDTTAPALSRITGRASVPVVIDEAEPQLISGLFPLLRAASGDAGIRARADQTGAGVQIQRPRFSALLANTAMPKLSRADASRLTLVRLGDPVEDWPSVEAGIDGSIADAPGVLSALIQNTEGIVDHADRLKREFQRDGMESRDALCTAALTAGWQAWGIGTEVVRSGIGSRDHSDAGEALLDILNLRLRVEGGKERTVMSLLQTGEADTQVGDQLGLRLAGDEGLLIAPRHKGLVREMERTAWGGADLRRLLAQISGATMTKNWRRFGPVYRDSALVVPFDALAALGIVFDDRDPSGEPPPREPPPDMTFDEILDEPF